MIDILMRTLKTFSNQYQHNGQNFGGLNDFFLKYTNKSIFLISFTPFRLLYFSRGSNIKNSKIRLLNSHTYDRLIQYDTAW